MAKESFVLVSLKEDKARKLAKVIQNKSCRKILDYLTSGESTETELSRKLAVPISTVHYNLKHLVDAGLVESDEFHYSQKGKEVNHYRLANKYIIIAPKSTFGIKERLRSVLPAVLVVAGSAFVIQLTRMGTATFGALETAQKEMAAAPALAADAALEAAPSLAAAPVGSAAAQSIPLAWFLGGAALALAVMLLTDWLRSRK